jgi:RNase H-like domain found in reverse transcriptase
MMPDHSKPFQIQVDSSLFATGGILSQMNTNGDRHPCAYLSKSLTKEQRSYDTGDQRATGNHTGIEEMEALYSRIWTYNDCLI